MTLRTSIIAAGATLALILPAAANAFAVSGDGSGAVKHRAHVMRTSIRASAAGSKVLDEPRNEPPFTSRNSVSETDAVIQFLATHT